MVGILSNSFLLLSDLFWWLKFVGSSIVISDLWELSLLGCPLIKLADTLLVHYEVGPIHYRGLLLDGEHTTCPLRGGADISPTEYTTCPLRGGEDIFTSRFNIYSIDIRQNITYMEHLHIALLSIYHQTYYAHIFKELIIYLSSSAHTRVKTTKSHFSIRPYDHQALILYKAGPRCHLSIYFSCSSHFI